MSRDRAASVRARLLNVAKATGTDFNLVLVRFALERLLYRLSTSAHADRFVLKGALLFTLWYDLPHRATRDADLLGFGASDTASMAAVFTDIAAMAGDDGITDEERSQLQSLARSRSLPASLSARAHIILSSADVALNSAITDRLELTKATVASGARGSSSDALPACTTMCTRASQARSMTNAWRI